MVQDNSIPGHLKLSETALITTIERFGASMMNNRAGRVLAIKAADVAIYRQHRQHIFTIVLFNLFNE